MRRRACKVFLQENVRAPAGQQRSASAFGRGQPSAYPPSLATHLNPYGRAASAGAANRGRSPRLTPPSQGAPKSVFGVWADSDQLRSEPSEGFPRIYLRPGSPRPARAASNKRSNHVQKSLRLLSASVRFFGFDRQCKLDQPPNSFWASSRNVLLRNPCIETRKKSRL